MDKGCRKRSKTIENRMLNANTGVLREKPAGYEDDQAGDVGERGVDTEIYVLSVRRRPLNSVPANVKIL